MNDERHDVKRRDEPPRAPRAGDPASPYREVTNLVKQYFNICNAALVHGTDGVFVAPARDLLARLADGETIAIEVSGTGEREAPRYTTRFVDGQFTPIRGGADGARSRFVLSREFLEDVERNASEYISHPEKLDWSWLRDTDRRDREPTR